MNKMRTLTLFLLALTTSSNMALAMSMVEGGFARSQASNYEPEPLTLNAPTSRPLLLAEIGFTPRHRSLAAQRDHENSISFRMDVEAAYGGGLDFNPPAHEHVNSKGSAENLLVGGAVELEEIDLLGGVGRTSLFGERADLVIAGMKVGGLKARFGVGETATEIRGARDVMMLSTDLRIAPWISVQGDLAVGERDEQRESLAVGRVGVRLRF